jgi:hypothetical protein
MIKRELALRVGFGIDHWLHPALQLNQNDVNPSRGLAGRAVFDSAMNRASPHIGKG